MRLFSHIQQNGGFNMFERYTFGSYPHDGSRENITWLVLETDGSKAKLISEYILDAHDFCDSFDDTWEDSSLRAWLQDDFLNTAFTRDQQQALIEELNEYEHRDGQEVIDIDYSFESVTLLSLDEVRKYFSTNDARIAKATPYAQGEGVEIEYAADCCGWWLRSPKVKTMGIDGWNACVMANGELKPWGVYTRTIGVRPVITVDLASAASCQYDMVEDDEITNPAEAIEKLQELLNQLKALRGDDEDDEDTDFYSEDDEDEEEEPSDDPVALCTITDVLHVNDVVSIQLSRDFVCMEELNKDGEPTLKIKSGKYTGDNGNTAWLLDTTILDNMMDADEQGALLSSTALIEQGIANAHSQNFIKFPGIAPAAFVVTKFPINLGGSVIKIYSLALLVPWDEGRCVMIINTYNAAQDAEKLRDSYRLFLEVAKSVRVKDIPLAIGNVSVEDMLEKLIPSYEENEEGAINLKLKVRLNDEEIGSLTYNTDGTITTSMLEELPETTPPGHLYSHYRRVGYEGEFGNIRIIVNANGTEFDPLSIEQCLEEKNSTEMLAVVRSYKQNDTYSLDKTAQEMAEVFRVDMDAFNSRHDRLSEILAGNLQKCYTYSALRSFAWTLAEMADNAGRDIEEYSIDELLRIVDFVAGEKWLNYEPSGIFKALCDQPDLHVIYVPETLCTPDHSTQLQNTLAQMPVASLDAFRTCLEKLQPVMEKLAEHLGTDRNRKEPLKGNAADVLYAWCSLCVAAKEPFMIEDGPMMCFWGYPGDPIGYHMRPDSPWTKALNAQREQEKAQRKAQWLEKYAAHISQNPHITIAGKKFVFTGLGVISDEQKNHAIVKRLVEQGGLFRGSISGATDYLVVGDDSPGESKIKAAIAQQEAGKPIQIIRLSSLEAILNGESVTGEQSSNEADPVVGNTDPEVLSNIQNLLGKLGDELQQTKEGLAEYGDILKKREEENQKHEEELKKARKNAVVNTTADEACMFAVLDLLNFLNIENAYNTKESFYESFSEDFPAYTESSLWKLHNKVQQKIQDDYSRSAFSGQFMKLDIHKRFNLVAGSFVILSKTFDINKRMEEAVKFASKWFADSERDTLPKELNWLKEFHRNNLHEQFNVICPDWNRWSASKPLLFVEYRNSPSPYDENTVSETVNGVDVVLRLRSSSNKIICTQVWNWYVWYWNISFNDVWLAAWQNHFDAHGNPVKEEYLSDETGGNNNTSALLCRVLERKGIDYRNQNTVGTTRQNTLPKSNFGAHDTNRNLPPPEKKKEGCYIATAVYGSYDAPEVMVLRHFRDNTLRKTALGRWFIRTYYRLSPSLAEKLKSASRLNSMVRKVLDKWVYHLSK